jgi:hypothetical protein
VNVLESDRLANKRREKQSVARWLREKWVQTISDVMPGPYKKMTRWFPGSAIITREKLMQEQIYLFSGFAKKMTFLENE